MNIKNQAVAIGELDRVLSNLRKIYGIIELNDDNSEAMNLAIKGLSDIQDAAVKSLTENK